MYVWIGDIVCCFFPRLELALWDHAQEWWNNVDVKTFIGTLDSDIFVPDLSKYIIESSQVSFDKIRQTISIEELFSFYIRSRGSDEFGPVIKRFSGETVTQKNLSEQERRAICSNYMDASYRNMYHITKMARENY